MITAIGYLLVPVDVVVVAAVVVAAVVVAAVVVVHTRVSI